MIYPSADKIDQHVESKYALVILAAKRAKQIKEGSTPLIATDSANPLTIALEEIAAGKVKPLFDENSLAGREALADKEAVIGKRDIEVEGLDPLALPAEIDPILKASLALGADADDLLLDDEEEAEEEVEEEEDNPMLTDEEEEGPEA